MRRAGELTRVRECCAAIRFGRQIFLCGPIGLDPSDCVMLGDGCHNDVAGSNSRRPGRRHPKHEEALWSATVRVPQDYTYYFHYPWNPRK